MFKKFTLAVTLATIVAGCSTTTASLKETGITEVIDIPENYQEVYRRVNQSIGCRDGAWAGAFASYQVDRQLYTELGYGEISLRLSNVGVNNYYLTTKVTKTGANSSRFEATAGNTLGSKNDLDFLIGTAQGNIPPKC